MTEPPLVNSIIHGFTVAGSYNSFDSRHAQRPVTGTEVLYVAQCGQRKVYSTATAPPTPTPPHFGGLAVATKPRPLRVN